MTSTSSSGEVVAGSNNASPPAVTKLSSLWRLAPDESYSDWTIKVEHTVDEDTKTQIYPIHRNIIASGPRQVKYFRKLFSGTFEENQTRSSLIKLDKLAADAFPAMLDYCYDVDSPIQATAHTATALFYLGQYLDCPPLRDDIQKFIQSDLTILTGPTYYEHAMVFYCEKILQMVIQYHAQHLDKLLPDSPFVQGTNPDIWVTILEEVTTTNIDFATKTKLADSALVSLLVAAVIKRHQETLSSELFFSLTDEKYLSVVHPNAAVDLLCLQTNYQYGQEAIWQSVLNGTSQSDDQVPVLIKRCVNALTTDWKRLGPPSMPVDPTLLMKLPSPVWYYLMTKSLESARQDSINATRRAYYR